MSMFLGPIHYMMFNKIKIAADRARAVIAAFKEKHGQEADETISAALPDGPVDFGDKPLDDLLGDAPIHGFLQGLIDDLETKEATLVTALMYRFPDDGTDLLRETYRNHGKGTAEKALEGKGGSGDLRTFEGLMQEFYLEGMPCDQVSSYMAQNEKSIEVSHSDCLHRMKWENAGAPTDTMCGLMDEWARGVAEAVNPGISLERNAAIVQGADTCTCTVQV